MANSPVRFLAVSALALALAACGREDTPAEAAPEITAEAGQPAALPGPFTVAVERMQQAMAAATAPDAQRTWAMKMVEHHRGGVAMAHDYLDAGQDPALREHAQMAVARFQAEIRRLEAWLKANPASGEGQTNPYAPAEQRMFEGLAAAAGPTIDLNWARKMVVHHQGGAEMTETALPLIRDPELRQIAERTLKAQREAAAALDGVLSGEPPPA